MIPASMPPAMRLIPISLSKGRLALPKLNGQALNPFPTHCPENGAPWACKGATGSDAFWWETVLKVLGFRKATRLRVQQMVWFTLPKIPKKFETKIHPLCCTWPLHVELSFFELLSVISLFPERSHFSLFRVVARSRKTSSSSWSL